MGESTQFEELANTLKSLKCSMCDNILSVAPIMTISEEKYQCGRCKEIPTKNAVRNIAFEKVAQHLDFPCSNKNCTQMIPWNSVTKHEKECIHNTIFCPMYYEGCTEKIVIDEFREHMTKEHVSSIVFENIKLRVPMFKPFICVAVVDVNDFFIYISSSKILVTSIKPLKGNFKYSMQITSTEKNEPSIVYNDHEIDEFNERKHCFQCLNKCCKFAHHPFSTQYFPNSEQPVLNAIPPSISDNLKSSNSRKVAKATGSIFTSSTTSFGFGGNVNSQNNQGVNHFFNFPTSTNGAGGFSHNTSDPVPEIKFSPEVSKKQASETEVRQLNEVKSVNFKLKEIQSIIGITASLIFDIKITCDNNSKKEVTTESYFPRNYLSTIDNSDLLRKLLECPICTEYFLDKVSVCLNGHSICSKCRSKISVCPSCEGSIDGRNAALITAAEECSISCCNKEGGCEFRGNLKAICKHEQECPWGKENI